VGGGTPFLRFRSRQRQPAGGRPNHGLVGSGEPSNEVRESTRHTHTHARARTRTRTHTERERESTKEDDLVDILGLVG
jgi:hypothetical protein